MIDWHLEKRPLKDLIPNPKNPRRLTKDQLIQLEKSLETFGIAEPIIINTNNMIIGGHQRVSLLKKRKLEEVWCSVPDHELTEDELNEFCIRLNKNTGEWDFDMLANLQQVSKLIELGFSMEELVGLSPEEIISETIDEISLPNGEKGLSQITFTLTAEQSELINRCLNISKDLGEFVETGNENSNGNALARICELWFGHYGKS